LSSTCNLTHWVSVFAPTGSVLPIPTGSLIPIGFTLYPLGLPCTRWVYLVPATRGAVIPGAYTRYPLRLLPASPACLHPLPAASIRGVGVRGRGEGGPAPAWSRLRRHHKNCEKFLQIKNPMGNITHYSNETVIPVTTTPRKSKVVLLSESLWNKQTLEL
jgi:hypothetical protein